MSNDALQWPPASPKDVLRLTPKKAPNNSIHSSPLRKSTTVTPSRMRNSEALLMDGVPDSDSDATTSEEDEEALQLQLKAIEMKLKLKRLQKEKKRKAATTGGGSSRSISDRTTPPPSLAHAAPDVQVPVSPSPRKRAVQQEEAAGPPPSPSRVLLGIDKGLTARDISLKRAPGMTNLIAAPRQPQFTSSSMSSTANSSNALRNATGDRPDPFASSTSAPVKTFSQRIAEQRSGLQAKEDKAKHNDSLRSKGWEVEREVTKSAVTTTSSTFITKTATSTSTAVARSQQPGGRLQTQRTTGLTKEKERTPDEPAKPFGTSITGPAAEGASASQESESTTELGPGFDSYSNFHLSRRNLPHTQLSRHLNSKEIFLIPNLLKVVHSPDYEPPDVAGDWVVMGIISSKSEPREVARDGGGKYIVFQLTDLKWEIDLFFFGNSFQKYYRIPVGTVLAILNPNIMKPRVKDSGKFSLTVSDTNDTDTLKSILEVGMSRDLGACKARKKDGKECGTWVDKRHTEFCDFHVEQTIAKARAGRMEVNSMGKLFSPPRKGGAGRGVGAGDLRPRRNFLRGGRQEREDGLLREGPMADVPVRLGGGGGNVYVSSVSSARLIDNDHSGDPFYREDRLKKQLARREREREIAKGLVAGGNSNTGMDYLKAAVEEESGKPMGAIGRTGFDPARRAGLEMLGDRSAAIKDFMDSVHEIKTGDVKLSPIKTKRKSSDMSSAARGREEVSPTEGDEDSGGEKGAKRTRKFAGAGLNSGPVGWTQAGVRKHMDRNVALTSTGGLKQTQIGWKRRSRSRSASPVKQAPPANGGQGLALNTSDLMPVSERAASPTKSSMKTSGKVDLKSVKFAPIPSGGDDSSDDDLEIMR